MKSIRKNMYLKNVLSAIGIVATVACVIPALALANETGLPHDMKKISGQEDFVHVWTLGVEGVGDEQDKLVTIDVNPNSSRYGTVVSSVSVGGRNEANHMGLTIDRRYLWGATLDTSKIFIFDIHSDPSKPELIKTIKA